MHWCAGHWAHLALLAAVGGALALGAEQQLVQRLATVLVVAEPGRVGALGGARCSSSILSVWHDGLAPGDGCQVSTSPTQEAGLLSLCLAREPASSRPAQPPRRVPPKAKRARALLPVQGEGRGARNQRLPSACVRSTSAACAAPSARRLPDLGQAPLCALPLLPPACGEAFVATLARANLAVSGSAHS